jgi:ParB family chromosome partitioning protein
MSPRASKSSASASKSGAKSTSKSGAKKPASPRKPRKAKAEAGSVGLAAEECAEGQPTREIVKLASDVVAAGGVVLSSYREPLGGHWVALAALPIDKVKPTPYQRELSKTHADRLATVIPKVGRFLDPIITVAEKDAYWTPNGMHRLEAMRKLGAKTIVGLLVPEAEIAFRILALNTEKAHNLKDKSLEVMRMERALADDTTTARRHEADWAFEFEEPAYLTVGLCYEKRPRFAGAVYLPVLKRCEEFIDGTIHAALKEREDRADKVLELDDAVAEAVDKLKAVGLRSPYLKAFVVARINPLRFVKAPKVGQKAPKASFDATFGKMIQKARAFDASKIRQQDITISGGPADEQA